MLRVPYYKYSLRHPKTLFQSLIKAPTSLIQALYRTLKTFCRDLENPLLRVRGLRPIPCEDEKSDSYEKVPLNMGI